MGVIGGEEGVVVNGFVRLFILVFVIFFFCKRCLMVLSPGFLDHGGWSYGLMDSLRLLGWKIFRVFIPRWFSVSVAKREAWLIGGYIDIVEYIILFFLQFWIIIATVTGYLQ